MMARQPPPRHHSLNSRRSKPNWQVFRSSFLAEPNNVADKKCPRNYSSGARLRTYRRGLYSAFIFTAQSGQSCPHPSTYPILSSIGVFLRTWVRAWQRTHRSVSGKWMVMLMRNTIAG
jgi:hypothetical protein